MASRAYAGQLEIAAALESLRRRAGTEFDPVVVEAPATVVADEAAPSPVLVS
jgi:HD-GYP domain-containing protein (c-di-GMP phosphodiesterase class II)